MIPQSDSLSFPDCSIMTEEDIVNAITKVCDAGHGDPSNEELREVKLLNCGRGFTDRTAAILTQHCQALDTLVLTGCYKLNDTAISSLIISGCGGNLTALDLSCNLRLGATALSVIGSVPQLVSLTLNNVTHITDNELDCLLSPSDGGGSGGGSGSSSSDGSSSSSSSSSGGGSIGTSRALQTMKSLRHLSLSGLMEITDTSIQRIILSCGPQLHSLNISGCSQLTDRSIEAIRNMCSNLHSIDVSQLPEVSTAALIGLFIANPMMLDQEAAAGEDPKEEEGEERSHVRPYTSLSPPSIGRLSYVNLQGNVNTTDEVIVHLSEMSRSTLRHLDINGCNQLSNLAAVALKMNCNSTLEHLDMSFVRGCTEDAVGALVDTCAALKSLHVWVSSEQVLLPIN